MANDKRTLRVVVVGDSTSAQRSIRDVGRSADELKVKASATQVALGTFASMGAAKLLDLGKSAVLTGVQTASAFQQSQVAFTNMLGSGTKANAFLDQIKKMAAETPFEFPDLVTASQRLLAMGFSAKSVIPTLTAAGDAVSAMGGGKEQVNQVVMALGQMQAKGKIAGDEILQLTEAGIPAIKILANQYHVTTAKMQEMVSKGQVLSDKAIPLLVAGLENGTKSTQKFGGMMAAQSQTLAGKWSTFTDTVKTGLGNMFTKAMPAMNAGLDFLSKGAGKVFSGWQSAAAPAVTYLKNIFTTSILPAARAMWDFVGPMLIEFGNFLKTAWEKAQPLKQIGVLFGAVRDALQFVDKYKAVFQPIAVGILAIVAAQKAWTIAVAAWNAIVRIATAVQVAWDAAMDANPIGLIVLAIAGLVAGIAYAWTHFAGFRNFVIGVWDAIKTAAQKVASWFMSYVWPVFVGAFNGIKKAAQLWWSAVTAYFRFVQAVVNGVVSFFMSYVWPVLRGIFNFISGAVKVVSTIFKIYFGIIEIVVKSLVYLFMRFVWPILKAHINLVVSAVKILWSAFSKYFTFIRNIVQAVVSWVRNVAWAMLSGAFNLIKNAVVGLWNAWKHNFDLIKSKVETVMNGAKIAFSKAKDAIGSTWSKLRDLAKEPVNFVIQTVYNNGIRKFWNAIATKVGAKPLEAIPKLAGGGRGIPSQPGIVGDWVPFYGQAGEYVLNRKQVAKAGGWRGIEALFGAAGRDGASAGHYDRGGILGGIANAGNWLLDKGKDLVKGSLLKVAAPLINTIRAAINQIPGKGDLANAIRGLPTKMLDNILAWIKPKDKAEIGNWDGHIAPGVIGAMQKWALAQAGKTYLWSAVGPAHYDCSGMVGNLWALATGNPLYRRYMSTSDMGSGRHGMVSGPGQFTIFLNRAGGHTAADVGGLHVEAYGGNGTPNAIGRIGTRLSFYNEKLHLPGLAAGGLFPTEAARLASFMQKGWPEPPAGVKVPRQFKPLEWKGVDREGIFDSGGILRPGVTLAHNNTGRNEYVSTDAPGVNLTVTVIVQGNVTAEKDLAKTITAEVRDELVRIGKRNGGKTGLG